MRGDKIKVNRYLKTARGQMDGILKMIEEDAYCVDISNQLLAVIALIKKANHEVLGGHIKGCVKDALNAQEAEEKIEEVLFLLERMGK